MASFVYAVWSITNVASVHCSVRPEISPCTCEPTYAHNYVELSCEKVDSFHTIVDALSNKFEPFVNISLKITHSQLEDLEMLSFTDMKLNLVKLRMLWNGLKSVPELPFRGLSNVEYLGLGDNELEEIPKHMLNHMPVVKTLDIGRCRIRAALQDDFKGTQMLTNLFMPTNNLTRLDRATFPPGLVTLHLGRNNIESLNGTLRHLNKLESLFINKNCITSLEDELPESNRLKLIMAQNNMLVHLPERMREMDKLETLHVQHNHLISLDRVLKNAKNLNEFYAFDNRIESLARDEFQMATKLEELYIAGNNIKSLNGSLLSLQRLCKANFSYNSIDEFSMDEIRGLMSLKQLDLSKNNIRKLSGRQENNIDKNSYLTEFYLDFNELTSLDGALMGLNSLRILGLTHNKIERILPEDFIGLERLEILELSHNKLLTLREMQTTVLPSLKILKVDYNNLTILDKDFHGLPVLCQAHMTNNQIISISHELVAKTSCMNHNVPGKLELYLEDNPFHCKMLLDEYCPLMANTEKRIRLRTKCFEGYEDVCKNRQYVLMVPTIDLAQQVIPVILPSTDLLKKADNLLPPLFAPLGNQPNIQPIILAPAIQILEPTTSTPITTAPTPTQPPTTTTSTTITTTVLNNATLLPLASSVQLNETIANADETTTNNETVIKGFELIKNTTSSNHDSEILTLTVPLGATQEILKKAAVEVHNLTTTQKPSILVLNMDDSPPSVITINANADAQNNNVPKTEYDTVRYISNNHKVAAVPNMLIDDYSKSNSIHEEFHTKIITDFDNYPPSLLQPVDPPENP